MTQNTEQKQRDSSLKRIFSGIAGYVQENRLQSAALLTSVLLGTTALATPLLTSAVGAAVLLTGSIALLLENSKTVVQNTLATGKKLGLAAGTLGIILGSLNTIPEVSVSIGSIWRGAIDLGVGNVVGSNIIHNLFILGATAAVAGIAASKDLSWKFNAMVMTATSALFAGQLVNGQFSPWVGLAMLGLGAWYLKRHFLPAKKSEHSHDHGTEDDHDCCRAHDHDDDHHGHGHSHGEDDPKAMERPRWLNIGLTGAGMTALIAAGDLVVRSGISLADHFNLAGFNLSQAAIGAAIVAVGTALPEIFINLQAIRSKQSDLAVGNVLGCSIVNGMIAGGILSFTGAPVPEAFNPATPLGALNIAAFAGSAAVLTGTLLLTKGALSRWQGALAVTAYAGYLAAMLLMSNGEMLPGHNHTELSKPMEYTQGITPAAPPVAPL